MKKLILSLLALLPLAVSAQKPFSVTGNVKGLKTGDKIYFIYKVDGAEITDSATVNNGLFAFKGSVSEPTRAGLFLNKNPYVQRPAEGEVLDYISLYVDAAPIKVDGVDSLKKVTVSGSVANDDSKKLEALIKPVALQMAAIESQFVALSPEEKKIQRDGLLGKFKALEDQIKPIQLNYAKSNPKSFISIVALSSLAADATVAADAEKAFNGLNPALKTTPAGKNLAQLFAAGKATIVGAVAMDFTQNDVNGKPVKLSDFKGKYVLVDFWASWCGPCRAENPNVVKAYNAFKDQNFTVLGVSLDNPGKKDSWLAAIEKDGLNWTNVSDLKGWGNEVAVKYGVRSIPANYLIDPNGKIVAKDVRGEDLHTKLKELLSSTKTR